MANLINLTPHPITILDQNNNVIRTIQSSGLVRLKVKASTVYTNQHVQGVPVSKTVFGEPEGLPETKWYVEQEGGMSCFTTNLNLTLAEFESQGMSDPYVDLENYYIVSQLVKSALPNRPDLLVPAEVQRDSSGNIIGCRSLGI